MASRSKRALVALVGGLGAVSGFSPSGLPWLTLACLALLFLVWLRTPTPREAALNGFLFGLGLFGAGASWVYISLHDFGMMPAPLAAAATAFFCVYLALFPALAGSLQARLDAPSWMQAIFVIPGCWVITEWMRSWLLTGFPWLAMGYSQVDSGFSGYAPLMGMYGVSLLMAMAAGSIAAALLPAPNAVRARLVLVAIGIFAVGVMLRLVDWVTPHGAPVPVALIQGNIAQEQKFEPQQYLATLATYQRLIESTKAQLVVLPETAVPRFLDLVDPDYLDGLAAIMRRRGGDLLLGAPFRTSNGNYYNGVVNLGHSDLQFYAKSHLVPLGEFVPAEFKWIVSTLRIPLSDFSAGKRSKPLLSAGERIGITVCYEDAFGEELISQLPEATLLANLSNVAWFGDSLAPGQHLQISRMRSIEAGRYMLRATNTGVTAIIDQRGNVEAQLPLFSEGVLHGNAQAFSGATPYVRVGNYLSLVLCWLFLLGGIALSLRSRHSQATAPH
ncbi:MAG: apolipoprotein N-acyltransferase [Burkholderiales bacterium]